jgi:dihydroorotase
MKKKVVFMKLSLPKWYDLHVHLRQGDIMPALIEDQLSMGCAGVLAMPNTKPPVGKVFESDTLPYDSIEAYRSFINASGGEAFDQVIVPLYLTKDTTPAMIEEGAKSELLKACKYYPPHGTTGAEFGHDFISYIESGVFEALQDAGVVLCVHGEEHAMEPERYFDRHINAEEYFYKERLPVLLEKYPDIKLSCEHMTTKVAVDFVSQTGPKVGGTITPQHLIYTVGDLVKGLQYHLYCLPLLKFDEDRQALRDAVTNTGNTKFFAGTDSAPHTDKVTPCGCAAGCYTGGIAPQMYVEAFELAGCDMSAEQGQKAFEAFLCTNGPAFYGFPAATETFTLTKQPQTICERPTAAGSIVPLPVGLSLDDSVEIQWSIG